MNLKTLGLAAIMCVVSLPAMTELDINDSAGTVSFSGKHAGMTFNGEFESWTATIHLPNSSQAMQGHSQGHSKDHSQGNSQGNSQVSPAFVKADFDLSSAETGDSLYNETLLEGDWFDVENHPRGGFESESVVSTAEGHEVIGNLTLRGKTLPISFILQQEDGRLLASFDIDRLAYGIGVESDPDAEWVSQFINLQLNIPADQ